MGKKKKLNFNMELFLVKLSMIVYRVPMLRRIRDHPAACVDG